MNVQMMLATADRIERERSRFDMFHWCGTTACVAGYAYIAAGGNFGDGRTVPVAEKAMKLLDLPSDDAARLFGAAGSVWDLDSINRSSFLVPDALRWMALAGRVSWDEGMRAARCVYEKKLADQVAYTHLPLDWIL